MKITKYSIILLLIISCQNTDKREKPLKIQEGLLEGDRFDKTDSLFIEMIKNEIITNPEEKKYISNIVNLKSINLINCDPMNIHYKDLVNGKQIEFNLSIKKFNKKNHKIKYKVYEENEFLECESIDGKVPLGAIYRHPKAEISDLTISINGNQIEMKDELRDIFNFQMCNTDYRKYFNPNPLLKYDEENDVFYLYIKGGSRADNYFVKFVFNEKEFIKRYLLHYGKLSESGSFRMNFKGF